MSNQRISGKKISLNEMLLIGGGHKCRYEGVNIQYAPIPASQAGMELLFFKSIRVEVIYDLFIDNDIDLETAKKECEEWSSKWTGVGFIYFYENEEEKKNAK